MTFPKDLLTSVQMFHKPKACTINLKRARPHRFFTNVKITRDVYVDKALVSLMHCTGANELWSEAYFMSIAMDLKSCIYIKLQSAPVITRIVTT